MLRDQLTRIARGTFEAMTDWSDADSLAVPMAAYSTQAQVAQAGMLQSMVSIMNRIPIGELDLSQVTGDAIRDGDITESWRVPIYALWGAMGDEDVDQDVLLTMGRDGVETQAITDLSYSQREAMRQIARDNDGIIGYWRVPSGGDCEFCELISTQLYHEEDLMPVHPGCQCSVEPAFASDTTGGGD